MKMHLLVSTGSPEVSAFDSSSDGTPLPQTPVRKYAEWQCDLIRESMLMRLDNLPFSNDRVYCAFIKLGVSHVELLDPPLSQVKALAQRLIGNMSVEVGATYNIHIEQALRDAGYSPDISVTLNGDSAAGRTVVTLIEYARTKLVDDELLGGRWPATEIKDVRAAVAVLLAKMKKRPSSGQ